MYCVLTTYVRLLGIIESTYCLTLTRGKSYTRCVFIFRDSLYEIYGGGSNGEYYYVGRCISGDSDWACFHHNGWSGFYLLQFCGKYLGPFPVTLFFVKVL